jgi:ABC-type microcin C transport system permease subunit YejE
MESNRENTLSSSIIRRALLIVGIFCLFVWVSLTFLSRFELMNNHYLQMIPSDQSASHNEQKSAEVSSSWSSDEGKSS